MIAEKKDRRNKIKLQLQNLDLQKKQAWQKTLVDFFRQTLAVGSGVWAGYQALSYEADLQELWTDKSLKIQWAFPKVQGKELYFYTNDRMETGAFGLLEPIGTQECSVPPEILQGVLVPGLCFDTQGYRLGHGQGFYDRFLPKVRGCKVGVGFSLQILQDFLPVEPHDQKVDVVVTNEGFFPREFKWSM